MKQLSEQDCIRLNIVFEKVIGIIKNKRKTQVDNVLIKMNKNINICIQYEFDGLDELTDILKEEWKSLFHREKMDHYYIEQEDVDEMAKVNIIFQDCITEINSLLGYDSNLISLFVNRKWYTKEQLKNDLLQEKQIQKQWEERKKIIIPNIKMEKSPIEEISDEIWCYVKNLGISQQEDKLINWFNSRLEAFYYLSPIQIVREEHGEIILKKFLLSFPR